jgi:hypothetical protein
MGTGIEAHAAGIGIPASGLSVRHQSIPVSTGSYPQQDWFLLGIF